jgi:hypothetical protein
MDARASLASHQAARQRRLCKLRAALFDSLVANCLYAQLRYNEILLSDTCKSNGEVVLQALEQAELINIHDINGRPHSVGPGKPVYASAFKILTEDHVLRARLDLSTTTELMKLQTQSLEKYESELQLLSELPGGGKGVDARIKWLLDKLKGAQEKIEGYERESAELKAVLKTEF